MANRRTGSAGLVLAGALFGGAALFGCGAGATCGDGVPEEGGLCYGAETSLPLGAIPGRVVAKDLDGDGDQDLAFPSGEEVVLLLNDGVGAFTQVSIALGVPLSGGISGGDLDGDDDQDLVVGESGAIFTLPGQALILNNDGAAGFTLSAAAPTTTAPSDLVIADFDGDGDADIASANANLLSGSLDLLRNDDGVFVNAQSVLSSSFLPEEIDAVDADSDGDLDVLMQGLTILGGETALFTNAGDAQFQLSEGLGQAVGQVAGDLNGDGAQDIILADSPFSIFNSPPDVLTVHFNNGDNGFEVQDQKLKARGLRDPESSPREVAVGDLDGDGDLDVAVGIAVLDEEANPIGGRILLFSNNGEGKLKKSVEVELSITPSTLASADLNSDGVDDLIVTNFETASLFVVFSEP